MALEQLRTGQDILFAVLKSAGQSASLTDDYATDAKLAINNEYLSILRAAEWPWAKANRPAVLTTVARIQRTASPITGAAVTLSATISESVAGRKFYVDSSQAFYRILSHTAGTAALTLDAEYVETQNGGACTIYQDEYSLPGVSNDCVMPINPLKVRGQWERDVHVIAEDEFRARYGWNTTVAIGIIEAATMIRFDTAAIPAPVIQIAPWTTERLNIEYDYIQLRALLTFDADATTDLVRIPQDYRWVLYELALAKVLDLKEDSRSARAFSRGELGMKQMVDRYCPTGTRPRMTVRHRFSLGVG